MHNPFLTSTSLLIIGPMLVQDRYARELIDSCDGIIFVDGGTRWRGQWADQCTDKIVLSLGDGDSYQEQPLDVTYSVDKDRSDLSLALDLATPSCRHIHLFGFLGGRLDHQFVNFGVLHRFLARQQVQVSWYEDHSSSPLAFSRSPGQHEFQLAETFTVLSLATQQVTITGEVAYEVHHETLEPASDRFLSNRAQGSFTVQAENPFSLLMGRES